MKKSVIIIAVVLVIGIVGYLVVRQSGKTNSSVSTPQLTTPTPSTTNSGFDKNDNLDPAIQDLQIVDKNVK